MGAGGVWVPPVHEYLPLPEAPGPVSAVQAAVGPVDFPPTLHLVSVYSMRAGKLFLQLHEYDAVPTTTHAPYVAGPYMYPSIAPVQEEAE